MHMYTYEIIPHTHKLNTVQLKRKRKMIENIPHNNWRNANYVDIFE